MRTTPLVRSTGTRSAQRGGEIYLIGNPPYQGGTRAESRSRRRTLPSRSRIGPSSNTWTTSQSGSSRALDYIVGTRRKARRWSPRTRSTRGTRRAAVPDGLRRRASRSGSPTRRSGGRTRPEATPASRASIVGLTGPGRRVASRSTPSASDTWPSHQRLPCARWKRR